MPVLLWFLAVHVLSAIGMGLVVWREKRKPSSYTRSDDYLHNLDDPPLQAWAEQIDRDEARRLL